MDLDDPARHALRRKKHHKKKSKSKKVTKAGDVAEDVGDGCGCLGDGCCLGDTILAVTVAAAGTVLGIRRIVRLKG